MIERAVENIGQDLQSKFLDLAVGLSPENIWMDGEATKAQAAQRTSILLKQWETLEAILGRKVSEDEIWLASYGT